MTDQPTPEALEAEVKAHKELIDAQVSEHITGAIEAFVKAGWTEVDALREIAHQGLSKSILFFNLMPDTTRNQLAGIPLVAGPAPQ